MSTPYFTRKKLVGNLAAFGKRLGGKEREWGCATQLLSWNDSGFDDDDSRRQLLLSLFLYLSKPHWALVIGSRARLLPLIEYL